MPKQVYSVIYYRPGSLIKEEHEEWQVGILIKDSWFQADDAAKEQRPEGYDLYLVKHIAPLEALLKDDAFIHFLAYI